MPAAPNSRPSRTTTPGPDRQELRTQAPRPQAMDRRYAPPADLSQDRPAAVDGTPPGAWVNMICRNARADTAQTPHPGHVSPQRPLYGSAVMPPQPRRPGNRSPATPDMFHIRAKDSQLQPIRPNVQSGTPVLMTHRLAVNAPNGGDARLGHLFWVTTLCDRAPSPVERGRWRQHGRGGAGRG
jgi:hypothetical protein